MSDKVQENPSLKFSIYPPLHRLPIKLLFPNKIIYENICINETIHLIKQNYPIIIKPLLLNEKYNIHVSCDIIIT